MITVGIFLRDGLSRSGRGEGEGGGGRGREGEGGGGALVQSSGSHVNCPIPMQAGVSTFAGLSRLA